MEEKEEQGMEEKEELPLMEESYGKDEIDGSGISGFRRRRGIKVSGKYMAPLEWERVERNYQSSYVRPSNLHRPYRSIVMQPQFRKSTYHTERDVQGADGKMNQQEEQQEEENPWKEEKLMEKIVSEKGPCQDPGDDNNQGKKQNIAVSGAAISKETLEELKTLLKDSPLITSRQREPSAPHVQKAEGKPTEGAKRPPAPPTVHPQDSLCSTTRQQRAGSLWDQQPRGSAASLTVEKPGIIKAKPLGLKPSTFHSHGDAGPVEKHEPSNLADNLRDMTMSNYAIPSLPQSNANIEHVKQQIAREEIQFIRFEATDLHGILRSKTIPARFFQEKALHGVAIPRRSHLEMQTSVQVEGSDPPPLPPPPLHHQYQYGNDGDDILLIPDLSTFRPLPWVERTARVLCDQCRVSGSPVVTAPRQVAKLQLRRLRDYGFSLRSTFTYQFSLLGGLHDGHGLLPSQPWLQELMAAMLQAGVDVESFSSSSPPLSSSSTPWPGQDHVEISLRPQFGLAAADNAYTFKSGVKEMAEKHQYSAIFLSSSCSSGNHGNAAGWLTHSLWDTGGRRNLFGLDRGRKWPVGDPPAQETSWSEVGRKWLGGLAEHEAALGCLLLLAEEAAVRVGGDGRGQSSGSEAGNGSRSDDGRTVTCCSFRRRLHGVCGPSLDNRLPSAAADPYLVLAATVAAGLDGLKRGLSPDTRGPPQTLPLTPLDALQRDSCLRSALGEAFVRDLVAGAGGLG